MDESTGNDRHWLDDRLRGIEGEDTGFTVVNSPLRPVVERGDPWKADVRHHELKAFIEPLAPSSDGRARVAIMTDVEEDPVARVQTAVLLARRLAEQGRRVLLVDADVRHVGLSRWMPDRDLDAEGLVDVLQYGASVSALRRPGPIDGVDILAVGSYRPDDASLFQEDALLRLVQQLRGEADVVLVLAPAWVTDERFHPLLVHGDAVVVSLHLDRTLGPRLQELLQYLTGLNVPVAGLMTFAGPDAAERRVDDVFDGNAVDEDPLSGPVEQPLATPPHGVEPVTAPTDEVEIEQLDEAADDVVAPRPETRPRAIEPHDDDDGSSSRVFRFAAVGALLVILAFVGWWGLSSRTDEDSMPSAPGRPPARVADATPPAERDVPGTEQAQGAGGSVTEDAPLADTPNVTTNPTDAANDDGNGASSGAETADTDTAPADVATGTPADQNAADDTAADEPADETAEVREPAPTSPSPAADEEVWERALTRAPGGGYALHVASFADAARAESEVAILQRDHEWQPTVVEATIDGKLWYRVLVGRFEQRSDALAARGPVGEIMKTDWIGVVRVP